MKPTKIWKHTKKTAIILKFDSEKATRAAGELWRQRIDSVDLSGCKGRNPHIKLEIRPIKKRIRITIKGGELNKFMFG